MKGEHSMPTLKEFEKWLTTQQAADRLGKTRAGIVWMAENKRIRAVRTALGWLVDYEDVERQAQERSQERRRR